MLQGAEIEMSVTLDDGREFGGLLCQIVGSKLGLEETSLVAQIRFSGHLMGGSLVHPDVQPSDVRVLQHITRILEVVGVQYWEELKGNYVIALSPKRRHGMWQGIVSPDYTRAYVTRDTFAEMTEV